MKKWIVTGLLILISTFIFAQEGGDAIVGTWMTHKEESKIEIYKRDGKYFGKVVWLLYPNFVKGEKNEGKPRVDQNNPDTAKRTRPILGLELLTDFTYKEKEKKWTNGKIYAPEGGSTYTCNITFEGDDKIKVTGSIDQWGLIGKTVVWRKIKETDEKTAIN